MKRKKISTPGLGSHVELSATIYELKELYLFLSELEYRLYDTGPEWLLEIYEQLDEEFAWE